MSPILKTKTDRILSLYDFWIAQKLKFRFAMDSAMTEEELMVAHSFWVAAYDQVKYLGRQLQLEYPISR